MYTLEYESKNVQYAAAVNSTLDVYVFWLLN